MNCREIKKLLIPLVESELSESERVAVETHLHGCDGCQKEEMLLKSTWSMLGASKAPEVSSDFTWNLMARIREQEQEKPKFVFVFPRINIEFGQRILVPALASACVMIVVYFFVQNNILNKGQVAKDIRPEQQIAKQVQEYATAVPEAVETGFTSVEQTKGMTGEDTRLPEGEKSAIIAADEDIIRNLDAYENIELYQNYALVDDFDVVEGLSAKVM